MAEWHACLACGDDTSTKSQICMHCSRTLSREVFHGKGYGTMKLPISGWEKPDPVYRLDVGFRMMSDYYSEYED